MPLVATLLSAAILLRAGSYPMQLLLYTDRERMTAQKPPEIYAVLCIAQLLQPLQLEYNSQRVQVVV